MKVDLGIGFVTGRRLFQNVLKTYINNWLEHGLVQDPDIRLHLFIAYDLKYKNTQISDYRNIPPELKSKVESINFYGAGEIQAELEVLQQQYGLSEKEASLIFGEGYGRKRNVVSYFAIKKGMDKLMFIDDDEYPLATIRNNQGNLSWMGQRIISTHLNHNDSADITHGHHCGYISPIPYIKFNQDLTEHDFKDFIEAISNDIISWEKIRHLIMVNKGVTYADAEIINEQVVSEVKEKEGMKFISGANLCFNLRNPEKLPPFYNPPGARGEDTFMSTALSDLTVLKVPCYTFHDGFSMYNNLLHGVLPVNLLPIEGDTPQVVKRFVQASIGWVRYKPLMVYITNRDGYEATMADMFVRLSRSIPKLCRYFGTNEFERILVELEAYKRNVRRHFREFEETKTVWSLLVKRMSRQASPMMAV